MKTLLYEGLTLHAGVEHFFSSAVSTELKMTGLFSSGHTVSVTGSWEGSMCSERKVCFVLTLGGCFHVTLPWHSAAFALWHRWVSLQSCSKPVVVDLRPRNSHVIALTPFCIDFA